MGKFGVKDLGFFGFFFFSSQTQESAGEQLAQRRRCWGKLHAAVGTLAVEGGHAVVAGGALEAGRAGAVVDVLAAVLARPAVDAHAVVVAVGVVAGPAILAFPKFSCIYFKVKKVRTFIKTTSCYLFQC